MRRLLIALLLLSMAGCSKLETGASVPLAETPQASARQFLAFEHSVEVDTDEGKVAAIYEVAQAACREAAADLCTVLESRISTGRAASASLKFRARPAGIKKLIAALGRQADITEQATRAEDLTVPIGDAEKKLAMLTDYRTRLEALRGRASTDVDALIKVNRELAEVQGELEALAGKHAHLLQRIDTEILNVAILSERNQTFWRPIALALSDFGRNLSNGISSAIVGLAYLIPWIFVLGLLAWGCRALWRRRKRLKAPG